MTSIPKTIIVSGADDLYLPLANDLFFSIRANKFKYPFDLGFLDVGLSEAGRQSLTAQGVRVAKVETDIDFHAREKWDAEKPGLRVLIARLFMRKYFPGYDIYIWLDADIWVQTPEAIDSIIPSVTQNPAIHVSAELDRCYGMFFEGPEIWSIYGGWYRSVFGNDVAKAMMTRPMLNAGVFAMAKDSPVWNSWAQKYADVLQKQANLSINSFMSDQLCLNIILHLENQPHAVMPATFNWLTGFARPYFDKETGLYVEPGIPFRPLSQIHLTRPNKLQVEKVQCLDGGFVERPLIFSARNR